MEANEKQEREKQERKKQEREKKRKREKRVSRGGAEDAEKTEGLKHGRDCRSNRRIL